MPSRDPATRPLRPHPEWAAERVVDEALVRAILATSRRPELADAPVAFLAEERRP